MKSFKNSFILYDDSLDILDELSDEESGRLFKAITKCHKAIVSEKTQWVNSDNLGLSRLEWVLLKPFYNQLVRDYNRYLDTCRKNKENGKKGGRPTKEKPSGLIGNPKNPDSDSDSDSDSGTLPTPKKTSSGCRIDNLPPQTKKELHLWMIEYAKEKNIHLIEVEKFINHWKDNTTKKAIKKDWKSTFRIWCSKDYVQKVSTQKKQKDFLV